MPILAGQSAGDTTLADLIAETRRHLESYQRPAMNKLDAAISPTATDLTFTFDSADIQRGTYLEIDLELFYVWSVEAASKTAVVERAQQGSKAVAHAAGAVVKLNPKFPDFAIAKAINDELRALSSPMNGLYAVELTEVTTTGFYGVPTTTTTVTKVPFGSLLLLSDDVEQVAGMPSSMHDIPAMGAAARLAMPREIRRNFFEEQGDSRRAEEVGPGAVTNSVRGLMSLRQTRITEEAARLTQLYPDRQEYPAVATVWP